MIIISHRGYWISTEEKNTLGAFNRSFSSNFGVETDIRDYQGNLVISHDIPNGQCLDANFFFETYLKNNSNLPLALNIKSDGLQQKLSKLLKVYQVENYFVFDMSVPDTLIYLDQGVNTFTRQSEYEPTPAFYEEVSGIWIDCFNDDWVNEKILNQHLEHGKKICMVSPELHNRDCQPLWQKLKKMAIVDDLRIMLCTDYPQQAREIFDDKD